MATTKKPAKTPTILNPKKAPQAPLPTAKKTTKAKEPVVAQPAAAASVSVAKPVKFTHIQDPRNQKRVLTLATVKTQENGSDVLAVGIAMNFHVTEWTAENWGQPNDVYDRKLGNKIAAGRAEKTPVRIELLGRHPMDAIRQFVCGLSREELEVLGIPYRAKQILELDGRAYAKKCK